MASVEDLEGKMRASPKSVRHEELLKVCRAYFDGERQGSGSHIRFKTPWVGDPRINIQDKRGMAKPYQVKQVLQAIDKLKGVEQ